jgi:pyridoxal phosphate-dependent aminotransferase EpsN
MSHSDKRIYLSSPHMGVNEQKFINEAFETNWISPMGPNVDEFERELASYVNVQGSLAVSSGTSAIHLALRLLGVGAGDIVFCSTLTFVATVNPILYERAEPVLIDSEPQS